MITDYIFNTPAATTINELPEETQAVINSLSPEWPSFPMIGTQEVFGRKLIYVRMNCMLSKAALEQMFVAHQLDWQVFSIRSAYREGVLVVEEEQIPTYIVEFIADKLEFLPFIQPIVVVDGDNFSTRPVTADDAIYLSAYAGTAPLEL